MNQWASLCTPSSHFNAPQRSIELISALDLILSTLWRLSNFGKEQAMRNVFGIAPRDVGVQDCLGQPPSQEKNKYRKEI